MCYNIVADGTEVFLFSGKDPLFTHTPDSISKNRKSVDGGFLLRIV